MALLRLKDPASEVEVGERLLLGGEPKILDFAVSRLVPLHPIDPAVPSDQLSDDVNALFGTDSEGGTNPGTPATGHVNAELSNVNAGSDCRISESPGGSGHSKGKRKISDASLGAGQSPISSKKSRVGSGVTTGPAILSKSLPNL